MATTWAVTLNLRFVIGEEVVNDLTLVGTGTYTTGGDTITAAALGMQAINFMMVTPDGNGANTNGVALAAPNLGGNTGADGGSVKMQLFGTGGSSGATLVEVGSGNTVTGITLHVRAWGY